MKLRVALAGMLLVAAFSCGDSDSTPTPKISGLMIYATDDFGNPNVFNPATNTFSPSLLWMTRSDGVWYGLGLLRGLPPDSASGPLLNAADFSVQIPLVDGTNDFTLLGAPFPLTRGDSFTRLALNIYFDGVLDHPGISVLFPRKADPAGSSPSANGSAFVFSLSVDSVTAAPQSSFTNGVQTVSVAAVSFLPAGLSGSSIDLVSGHSIGSGGTGGFFDWVGVLRINVGTLAASASMGG